MRFGDFFRKNADDMVRDIGRLVAIRSDKGAPEEGAPYGRGPRAALDEALEIARGCGFDAEIRGDRVLCVEYGDGEPELGILAHLDCVPAGDGWTKTEPFTMLREGDMLYGRGVADDKGPAVAALYALRCLKESGVRLGKKVQLLLGSDEESGSSDIRWYLENYEMPPKVFTPDGDFPVVNTEKGRIQVRLTADAAPVDGPAVARFEGGIVANAVPGYAEAVVRFVSSEELEAARCFCSFCGAKFDFEPAGGPDTLIKCYGEAAHASMPEAGDNAICALLRLLLVLRVDMGPLEAVAEALPYGDFYGETFAGECRDEESGPLTVNLGILRYDESGLTGQIDCRVPVCGDNEELFRALSGKLGERVKAELAGAVKPHHVPADSEFVRGLMEIYREYTGLDGEPMSMGGLTYVHHVEGGVAFGCTFPDRTPRMHEPDECMPVADLCLAAEMFAEACVRFCG